jgi:hypothetical protein
VTPTLAGSRPGGLVASCWASIMTLGQIGYEKNVANILAARREVLLTLILVCSHSTGLRCDAVWIQRYCGAAV